MTEKSFEEKFISCVPVPMCIVGKNGKVIESNDQIGEVFLYNEITDYDFFVLTGIKTEELKEIAENDVYHTIERSGNQFKVYASTDRDTGNTYVYFDDVTNYEVLKNRYNEEKVCVARVGIDNVDELEASTAPNMRMTITSQADNVIRRWAAKISGSIVSNKDYEYVIYFQQKFLNEMLRDKFSILDEVRKIETESDFPMSLSIGIGVSGKNILETRSFADAAIDLALGRGGDQAVVRNGSRIEYFGGKSQSVEKGNKGKSRVVAHALIRLIEQSSKVMIMGHRNPDMDAFGSALGVFRVCHINGKNASIVLSNINDSLQTIYKEARNMGIYTFINHEQALSQITEDTLLVVLDTHRPSFVECEELLDKTKRIVVIDHHRRAVDAIKFPVLSYIESYASSTAELVSEILQYSGAKKVLQKLEAQALLAGMTVDTNRFSVKTGVRTFEAAAWLRRSGADTTEIKKLFQSNINDFRIRAQAIAKADIRENGIATSVVEGFNEEAQIINSQVADELLNIRGIKATFVSGMDDTGKTVVSARSLGDINVQVIMEKLGGGGHLTTAGAQVDDTPEEVIQIIGDILEGMKIIEK